eukprot:CAMPEP_0181138270 /NCGR_PEP_ID=MMETSP1071-20121207/34156_1 /TAXON_ID=35127 /ORGANISM="Thalassiosira sp., Strain NH16" /LENGTH=808 /DNA_ID=CAMNT_0023225093 /DNA_START=54 /DNA_END=2480 /DNA_ORIENTATION=-
MTTTAAHDRYAGIFTRSSASTGGCDGTGIDNYSSLLPFVVVSPGFETRTLLESLRAIPLVDIGSDEFLASYCVNLERLSIQAHWTAGIVASSGGDAVAVNASSGIIGRSGRNDDGIVDDALLSGYRNNEEEEYIVEAFLEDIDRVEALVKTLLALELWRERILFLNGVSGSGKGKNDAAAIDEEDEQVEFEIEGGERDGQEDVVEYYNDLNDVDGGEEGTEGDIVPASTRGESDGFESREGLLASRLAANGNALRTAFILHAETTIVSMLSLIFYRRIPVELSEDGSSGGHDDTLLSLIDYCGRQLAFLGSDEQSNPSLHRQKHPLPSSRLSAYLETRSRLDEIQDSVHDSSYRTAVASVTLARYLCENANELGPGLLSRMLEVHDFPLLMVPLIEEPPWTRRRSIERRRPGDGDVISTTTIWEKLDDHNEWKEVPPPDLLRLTKLEGQPWLALFHLLTARACRESYKLDEYRKSRLMRVRKYLHETLTDQLPVLVDVARYMDELSILGVPPVGRGGVHNRSSGGVVPSGGLLLTRVDSLRESIVAGGEKKKRGTSVLREDDDGEHWKRIAKTQWEEIFSHVTDSNDGELRRIAAEVYGGAGMEDDIMTNAAADHASPFAGPSSTGEDWKEELSKPIEVVRLTMKDATGDTPLASFELIPEQNGAATATTDTPLGTFRRLKMSISQIDGDGDSIFPRASVVACIRFQKEPSTSHSCSNNEVELCVDSLQLPTIENDIVSDNTHDEVGKVLPENWPMKEWRQIGDLEGKSVVLQLGFKRLPRGMVPAGCTLLRGYTLSQAFLSQPCVTN